MAGELDCEMSLVAGLPCVEQGTGAVFEAPFQIN